MATDSDYNLTLQVVKEGFGSYLDGIVPQDVATACGAFSQTMRQIRNIDRIQIEKFAQVVANLETMKDLNVNGTDVPVDTPIATSSPPFIALGSGPQGSYTMSDFFGAMSGLPYIHHYKSAQGLLQRLETPYLRKIYEQMYLSVTWDNAVIGVNTTTTAVPDGAGGYNYYYQITGVNVGNPGGGYSRGDAPPPIIVIGGGSGATATVTNWNVTLDPSNPATFGRINGVQLTNPGTSVLYGSGTSATPPAVPAIPVTIESPPQGTATPPAPTPAPPAPPAPPPPPAPAVAPVANFTASPTSGTPPLAVTFTDSSTNSPTSWAWDFDNDGVVDSTAQNPTHTYPTAGTYSVKLVATNASGSGTEIKNNYITVSAPITVGLLSVAPDPYDFGSVPVGQWSPWVTITMTARNGGATAGFARWPDINMDAQTATGVAFDQSVQVEQSGFMNDGKDNFGNSPGSHLDPNQVSSFQVRIRPGIASSNSTRAGVPISVGSAILNLTFNGVTHYVVLRSRPTSSAGIFRFVTASYISDSQRTRATLSTTNYGTAFNTPLSVTIPVTNDGTRALTINNPSVSFSNSYCSGTWVATSTTINPGQTVNTTFTITRTSTGPDFDIVMNATDVDGNPSSTTITILTTM